MKDDYSKRLVWILPLLVGSYLPKYYTTLTGKEEVDLLQHLLAAVCISILILFVIFQNWINTFFKNLEYRVRKIYSPFIYENLKVTLEYVDDKGKLVALHREDHISKLGLFNGHKVKEVYVEVGAGEIDYDKVGAMNCNHNRVSDQKIKFRSLVNKSSTVGKEFFCGHSVELKDSFTKKEEDWVFAVDSFCKYLHFKIIAPEGKKFYNPRIYVLNDGEGKNLEYNQHIGLKNWNLSEICTVPTKEFGRDVTNVFLFNIKTTQQFMYKWELV